MNSRFILSICLLTLPVAGLAQNERALERSRAFLDANRGAWGLNVDHELRVTRVRAGAGNLTHVKHQQFYKGVPVFEGEAITHVDAAGNVTATNALRGGITLDVAPGITQGQAQAAARNLLRIQGQATVDASLAVLPKGDRSNVDVLTWHVRVFVENEQEGTAEFDLFLDARNGQVVWAFDSLHTASEPGTGLTMFAGTVPLPLDLTNGLFSMLNPAQSSLKTTDLKNKQSGTGTTFSNGTGVFGNGARDLSDRATAGADAHYGQTKTWEYYAVTFGRNGINNAGRSAYGRVHYGRNYENAFWSDSCFCMTYGDGARTFLPLVSLDVTGHEMTHGVTASESNLTYSGESGGLNEATSDIFGTMVEHYANTPNAIADSPDYWIGERIVKSNWSGGTYVQNRALRYMDDPAKDGASPACWSTSLKNLNVHYSSGPANHMFFLLAEGGTSKCNGNVVTGVGRAKASQIWYKALADYMTSSTNYAAARTAALNAASQLYGSTSAERNAVAAAFAAINVN